MSYQYEYIRLGCGMRREDAFVVECDFSPASWRYVARACAKDFHDEHDGWESNWPNDIEIFHDGDSLGVFTVEREYEPYFSPQKKPETNPPREPGG